MPNRNCLQQQHDSDAENLLESSKYSRKCMKNCEKILCLQNRDFFLFTRNLLHTIDICLQSKMSITDNESVGKLWKIKYKEFTQLKHIVDKFHSITFHLQWKKIFIKFFIGIVLRKNLCWNYSCSACCVRSDMRFYTYIRSNYNY
jgi:hypothetical protein